MALAAAETGPRPQLHDLKRIFADTKFYWLVLPAFTFFLIFFVIPTVSLFLISFDKSVAGVVDIQWNFTLKNYIRFFNRPLYYEAAIRSIGLAAIVSVCALALGYPLAYFVAKTKHPGRNTLYMILVLSAMQLDMVIRLFGLMVLMGDSGIVNGVLKDLGAIREPLPLMYNFFGAVVGLVQFTLPFMVLSLIGIIRSIHPSLEEAARSLGAGPLTAFRKVTLPIIGPGVAAGAIFAFIVSFGQFDVSLFLSTPNYTPLPIALYISLRYTFEPTAAASFWSTDPASLHPILPGSRRAEAPPGER